MGERALMDSARSVPPKFRMEWLFQHGERPRIAEGGLRAEADSGLRLVGKWGRGPAAEVTGRDTRVVLTLGSEVALLNFAKPDSPQVLSEIQFPSLTAQSYLVDSLLYTSSNVDLEVWNVSNPTLPAKRGELLGAVGDFWIRDTFLYFIRSDTFHVLSIANSANLRELGSCVESGSVTTGSGNTVVVVQNGGYAFVDVSNPASPHQVGTYPCGRTQFFSAVARGNLVCASYEETGYPYPVRFITLDISNPSSPRLLAKLNNVGGYDIFLDGPLAFVSGRGPGVENPQPFQMLSIADSAHPAFTDSCRTTFDYPWAIWEDAGLEHAFVANRYGGLAVVDVHNLNNPVLDTALLRTGSAVDVHVDGDLCYVAGETDGFRVLDVTDPARPSFLSGLDTFTVAMNYSIAARDSFAFVGWRPPFLRVLSVTDPLHPQMVAACALFNPPKDMILRDSFIYCAEDNRFEIVNVARPREPAVVGSCGMVDGTQWGLKVQDTLAYLGSWDGLSIVNVANPAAPFVVSQLSGTRLSSDGVAVRDTFAFVASVYETLWVYSVAKPDSPYATAGAPLGADNWGYDAAIYGDSLVCAGCKNSVVLVNVSDPANPRAVGTYPAPSWVRRVVCSPPYVYACCTDGGVMVLETTAVGVQEPEEVHGPRLGLRVLPNPAGQLVRVQLGPFDGDSRLGLYDISGKRVQVGQIRKEATSIELRLAGLSSGLYFLRVETTDGVLDSKIVKR
jgi:hypothetical protein